MVATALAAAVAAGPLLERDARGEADARLSAALGAGTAALARALAGARVQAVELATSPPVERALLTGDVRAIRLFERRHPSVAVTFGDTRPQRPASAALATAAVRDGGRVLGRVHVAVALAPVIEEAARPWGVALAVVRHGRVVSGPGAGQQLRALRGAPFDVRLGGTRYRALAAVSGSDVAGSDAVVALERTSAIAERARSRQSLAFAAALAALGAMALAATATPLLRQVRRRIRRRRDRRIGAREALALVGDALAATHEPRALLAIILTTAIEATGAVGGCLLDDGVEVTRAGASPRVDPLDLELDAGGDPGVLRLFPPAEGFSAEDVALARSLASQASIALENAHLHRMVERQAATDDLTQLANRRAFLDALEAEIRRSARSSDPFGLVTADLDDFKRVNDSYGHGTGDRVLAVFARIVRRELRDIDVAARIGGEEFAFLLPQTDVRGAEAVAERVRAASALEPFVSDDGNTLRVTVSLGVTAYAPGSSAERLLVAADRALYAAKAAGRNTVVVAVGDATAEPRHPAES